jgi:hypothetical protein
MSGLTTSTILKQLQTRQAKAAALQKALREEMCVLQERLKACNAEVSELNQRISDLSMNGRQPVVSEHAILRYLERVKGVDIAAIQAEILSADVIEQIKVIGSGKFPQDGYHVVVRKGTVITVET